MIVQSTLSTEKPPRDLPNRSESSASQLSLRINMPPTLIQSRIINFTLTSTGILATLFRLFDRTRNKKLWWDDAWAAFTMTMAMLFMSVAEVHFEDPSGKNSRAVSIAIYYLCAQCYYLVTWGARISILFTVIRITVPGLLRRLLVISAIMFGVTWTILFAQVFWVCESEPGWKDLHPPQCDLGRNVAIAQIVVDVLSDAILIAAPLRLVYGVTLTRAQRIRVTAIFSTTILTTALCMHHAYWVAVNGVLMEDMAALIQTSVGLIVVNLSVLVAVFFRISTDDKNHRPAPLEVRSILTFTNPDRRGRSGGETSTFVTTDMDTRTYNPTIQLETFDTGIESSKYFPKVFVGTSEERVVDFKTHSVDV
ncbi:hypothetical protein A0H81_10643 [Grifola frondosa]|uniref:Rhodopsin domain-containing protein n=1 Tax=Grifola frondosa TaxID=5627 RepID=A0A1C7LZ59_GRIFR|nr:hypothetical protein A0H81_10643 [Grifola frondosa]